MAADNSYGHPSPPVLHRLADNGARVLGTDLDGDIAVVSTSDGLAVVVTEKRRGEPPADSGGPRLPAPWRAAWLKIVACYGVDDQIPHEIANGLLSMDTIKL